MSRKVYEIVTQAIIKKLEEGTVPWRQPWHGGVAVNWLTQKPYRGINTVLLSGGEYGTFRQIQRAGGRVKKGEASHLVVFWKMVEVNDEDQDDDKETTTIPVLRYYRVFEIGEQVDGLERKRQDETWHHDPIEEAEAVKANYSNRPTCSHIPGEAWYKPCDDHINVPPKADFPNIHEYYSTLYHEMIHSTGHRDRLNRLGVTQHNRFGSQQYSQEELIAELGASMLCGVTGIDHETIDNAASYIQSWLQALKQDKTLIVKASQQAQKACDHILGS